MRLAIDRLWHDEMRVHGTVALDGAPHARVTVLPAIHGFAQHGVPHRGAWAGREASVGEKIWLRGSGFSPERDAIAISFGRWPCAVRSASASWLSCELGAPSGDAEAGRSSLAARRSLASRAGPRSSTGGPHSRGPGLRLRLNPLRTDSPECTASLSMVHGARSADCIAVAAAAEAAASSFVAPAASSTSAASTAFVSLRQQLVYPHETVERHSSELWLRDSDGEDHPAAPHEAHLAGDFLLFPLIATDGNRLRWTLIATVCGSRRPGTPPHVRLATATS